jgi:hypothetical protein
VKVVAPLTGDLRLVAPWWRRVGKEARTTRPVFQKYDSSHFVDDFLANPQRSLKLDAKHDRVQELVPKPAPLLGSRKRALADAELRPTPMLKLFLPNHKRFYLVVCELHTERAGFPCACREEVCEAGLVVRRRRFDPGSGSLATARKLVDRVEEAVRALAEFEDEAANVLWLGGERRYVEALDGSGPSGLHPPGGRGVAAAAPPTALDGPAYRRARERLEAARAALQGWASASGAGGIVEGWVVGPGGAGRWRSVKERPGRIAESPFPLYSLAPTPAAEEHIGRNRAIWFGTVPTSSSDHDEAGRPRFDDQSVYELRCFVRRHEPDKPKNPVERDCCGELTWSAPTERYRLAEQFDLTGTANHPVTIQLPDIPRLKAQAAALPIGKGAAVKLVSPAGSSLRVSSMTSAGLGGAQICAMPIPLVTIVAQFVFKIFLPIVVALLQLFALLRLKFCIPPSLSLDARALAALDPLQSPDLIDANAQAEAAVEAGLVKAYGDAAKEAVKEHTPSALAETVRTLARPRAAAKRGAPIDEPELEPEVALP